MRWAVFAFLLCAAVSGSGCEQLLPREPRPAAPRVARSLAPAIPPEGIIVESVLIEQPAGDPFLDGELWQRVLPVGSGETRVLLAENGLRAGLLTGNGPQRFQSLLESDADTVSPQRLSFAIRKEAVIPTAGAPDSCKFAFRPDLSSKPRSVELKQARCGVMVRPTVVDGRVRVWCEPQIQHGERQEWIRPNEDGTQFTRHEQVPLQKFPEVGFEAVLGPEDYLVLGWSAEQPNSLGGALFGVEAEGRPRQRVLVIRSRQANPQAPRDLLPIAGPGRRR